MPPAAYLEDGRLIFGFFSPWALGLCISFSIGLIFTTIVACWTDFGNRSTYGDLAAQQDYHKKNSTASAITQKMKPVDEQVSFKEVKKTETTSSSVASTKEVKKTDTTSNSETSNEESTSLAVESTQSFLDTEDTQIHESSSHLDASEKHARIIQAIYQVSRRDKNG
ncbi:unnamed protein product [Auanema sp. JU1783]|nr:unnamed protein product [Auanema sp. JU1783]